MYDNQRQFDALDILNILSFMLGLENLQENRAQSAHNDVQAANQAQADYLLEELSKRFEEQNKILTEILRRLEASQSVCKSVCNSVCKFETNLLSES